MRCRFKEKLKFSFYLPAVLALGIAAQTVQIVYLRELLMVFHGSELSLGIILAAWMIWVGAGSRIGARPAGRAANALSWSSAISAASMIAPVVSIIVVRMLRGVFSIGIGAYFSVPEMTISCITATGPAGFLFGMQFVMLCRMWRDSDAAADTSGAEKAYIAEAGGNVIAGVGFSLVLVHYLNSFQAVLTACALMTAAVVFIAAKNRHGKNRLFPALTAVLAVILAASAVCFMFLDALNEYTQSLQWKFFSPDYELIETRQSKYGNISAILRQDQYSFYQSGNLVFSSAARQSGPADMEEQEAIVFAHFAMVQHPEPKRVLLIGGGLRGTVREILRHPVHHVDYVELDPVLTDIARPYVHESTLEALNSPRVNLVHADGRFFIKNTKNTYDIVIVDMPDPATAVVNRFYTEEFFREAKSRLNPQGVMVTGAGSSPDMREKAVANRNSAIYHTLKKVYTEVLPAGDRFLFLFAGTEPGLVSLDPSVLKKRYTERGIRAAGFSPARFDLLLEDVRLRRLNWIIRNHGRGEKDHLSSPETGPVLPDSVREQQASESGLPPVNERFFINSDFKPIGYYYTIMFWDAVSGEKGGENFTWILMVRPWWIIPAAGACLFFTLFLKAAPYFAGSRADERFAVLLAVFTTGVSTMSLQIALIFSFQSLYGFVYEMIGIITAVFMGGLAFGTHVCRRMMRQKASIPVLLGLQFFIAVFAAAIAATLPLAGAGSPGKAVIMIIAGLSFCAGALNGADFPIAAACCQDLSKNPEKAAGSVYGVELFGACAGALASSVVVAPVLGIPAVCFMAAAANFTAFIALVISGIKREKSFPEAA